MASVSGADSLTPVSAPTTWHKSGVIIVDDTLAGAVNHWFGQQYFWGRYFGNNIGSSTTMSTEGVTAVKAEADALHQTGVHYIVPIHSPGNTGSTFCDGQAAGQLVCNAIVSVIQQSAGKITLPSTGHVFVYLDVEQGATLTNGYWNGWSGAVDSYVYNGALPFYPCCYTEPNAQYNPQTPCPVFCYPPNNVCYAIWSNAPESTANCTGTPPSWNPYNCSCVHTGLWQFIESQLCGPYIGFYHDFYPNADRDLSSPNSADYTDGLYVP